MAVPVATHKFVHGARLHTQAVHCISRSSGRWRSLPFLPPRSAYPPYPRASARQSISCFLLPIYPPIGIIPILSSLRNVLQNNLLQAQPMVKLSRKTSTFSSAENVWGTVTSSWQHSSRTRLFSKPSFLATLSYQARNSFISHLCVGSTQ